MVRQAHHERGELAPFGTSAGSVQALSLSKAAAEVIRRSLNRVISMDTLGDLLELLYGARDRFSTLRATVRTWRHVDRANEAMNRWAAQQPRGSVAVLGVSGAHGSEPERPQSIVEEQTSRLWLQKPSRWRHETDLAHGGTQVKIMDGDLWWVYDPRNGARTNEMADQPERMRTGIGHALTLMLDPSVIIPGLSMEPLGRRVHAGRDAVAVRGLPRPLHTERAGPELWPGADEYELLVDAERGVLLRHAAGMDGEEFAGNEITSVVFDEVLLDDVFTFTPPPGVKVRAVRPSRIPGRRGGLTSKLPWKRWAR